MPSLLSVDEALSLIAQRPALDVTERIALGALVGRCVAEDVTARLTQPPFAASAMDGYAVRFADIPQYEQLTVIGEAPAGTPYGGTLGAGEAVRIFTGGVVPAGADYVVIQEDTERDGDRLTITESQQGSSNIRQAGVDFCQGDCLVSAGEVFHELHGALLAAANIDHAVVKCRPRVAIFANGDELKEPGAELQPGEIINSNHYALTAQCESWGATARYGGCAPDDEEALLEIFKDCSDADIIVPIGGASVGDRDHMKTVFTRLGGELLFNKVAVKPGKPVWFGRLGKAYVLGLPGNPASAIVTAILFLRPLIKTLIGETQKPRFQKMLLGADLKANGGRETYLRAQLMIDHAGQQQVLPIGNQDSSLLLPFSRCDYLIRRLPNAPALAKGTLVDILPVHH